VSDHRLERRQFTAVEASGKVEQVAHALAESLNGQNPTGRLHSEALRHMLWAVPKLKWKFRLISILPAGCNFFGAISLV